MAHLCLSLHNLHQRSPDKVVLTCGDRRTTAAELHQRVALLSKALVNHVNVTPGSRVGILGLNTDLWWESLLSVLDAGAVGCPLNWRWSPAELAAALDLVQPSALFVDDHCLPLVMQAVELLIASNGSSSAAAAWALVRLTHSVEPTAGAIAGKSFGAATSLQQLMDWSEAVLQQHHNADAVAVAGPECKRNPKHMQSREQLRTSEAVYQPLLAPSDGLHDRAAATTSTTVTPQLQLLQPDQQQPALIVFTSGTTGASKGVMLSHSSLIHQALVKLAVVQYSSSDIYLHMAPLFHIGGLSSAFAMLMAGGTHVFMPRYSPDTALQLIHQHRVTSLIAVPAMMQDLTQAAANAATPTPPPAVLPAQHHLPVGDTPSQQTSSLSMLWRGQGQQLLSLQKVLVGAGGMSPQLQHAVATLFPRSRLHTAYGMTEAASSVTFITVAEQQHLLTAAAARTQNIPAAEAPLYQRGFFGNAAAVCVGQPAPGVAVKVLSRAGSDSSSNGPVQGQPSPADSRSTGVGAVGEVWTRGPHVMLGYWRDPDATRQALDPSGWLRTMDLGFLDHQGNLWLVGRVKDMIKTGGENVYAAEVEAVLMSYPAVAAAAVVGVPHPRLGEQVAAAVVLQKQWTWLDAAAAQDQGISAMLNTRQLSQQQKQQEEGQTTRSHHQQAKLEMQHPQQGIAEASTVSAAVLQQHCRAAQLSPYKLPRVLVHLRQLPLNSSGKVVKTVLKQHVLQLLSAGHSDNSSSGSSSSGQQPNTHGNEGQRPSHSKL